MRWSWQLLIGSSLLAIGCQPAPPSVVPPAASTAESAKDAVESKEQDIAPLPEKGADSSSDATPPAVEAIPAAAKVLLGSPELTSGIPGTGPLTLEQIKTWLTEDANHAPLEVELPFGLAAGKSAIFIPEDNQLTRAKIELGRQLYFDRRLCADGTVSCADCHHPDEGYAKHTQFGVGIGGQTGNRNSPTSYNRILSKAQFWDGRADSLEAQAVGPIANPIEMGNTHEAAVDTVSKIAGYKLQFEKIFPDGVTIENIGRAIASFERVLVSGPAPFDYYEPVRLLEKQYAEDLADLESLKNDDPSLYEEYMAVLKPSQDHPMSESAKRGRDIFFSTKGGCTACHVGPNLTDEKYHNLGIGMDKPEPDLGRYVVTKNEADRGAFKTPTIRNVEQTAPYMHDGSLKTLEEVVEWYDKGGHPNPNLSKDVRKLNLTAQEKADLVEFMKACTGEFSPVEAERLPLD